MTYEAWRMTYQDAEQAARAAYEELSAGLDANTKRLQERVRVLETTIATFLHDLDDHDCDETLPKVLMSNGMWLQVAAFRKLVNSI